MGYPRWSARLWNSGTLTRHGAQLAKHLKHYLHLQSDYSKAIKIDELLVDIKSNECTHRVASYLELVSMAPRHLKRKITPLSGPTNNFVMFTEENLRYLLYRPWSNARHVNESRKKTFDDWIKNHKGRLLMHLFKQHYRRKRGHHKMEDMSRWSKPIIQNCEKIFSC